MTIFISRQEPDCVTIFARAESEDGKTIGDAMFQVHPGKSAFGWTFEEWLASRVSAVEIDERGMAQSQPTSA
jgi:hypothetical protein